ncbi:MAG: UdgX family uracil-DNA binding protein [Candidatus Rokuibacteriota bacterium]
MTTGRTRPAPTLDALRRRAATCTACDLYKRATRTVFGEGPAGASMVLVGEQPGHEEDLTGRPFVGPAGRLLDRALAEAGIDRRRVYVTNAVKHFKWGPHKGGKRRIHERPNRGEVEACHPWLDQELWLIRPEVLVCLGVTAASAVLERRVTIRGNRGRALVSPHGIPTFVTVHPSAILRIPSGRDREAETHRLADDLRRAARGRTLRERLEETTR